MFTSKVFLRTSINLEVGTTPARFQAVDRSSTVCSTPRILAVIGTHFNPTNTRANPSTAKGSDMKLMRRRIKRRLLRAGHTRSKAFF